MSSRAGTMNPTPPEFLYSFDNDWNYYVLDVGDLDKSFDSIGYPGEFDYEQVWLSPVPATAIALEEWPDGYERVTRDEKGRYATAYLWQEAREGTAGAVRYFAARYKKRAAV